MSAPINYPSKARRMKTAVGAVSERELTKRQLEVVDTVIEKGLNQTQAAQELGITLQAVRQVLCKPHVQAHYMRRVSDYLGRGSAIAAHRLVHLVSNAKSEYVQLEAAKDVLTRCGFNAPTKTDVTVSGSVSISIDLGEG